MAENIRKAKSYKCAVHVECSYVPEFGKPPVIEENASTDYWLAPGASRYEIRKELEPETTYVCPAENRPWISIDHRDKTFCWHQFPMKHSPIERLADLGKFVGDADRELGTRQFDGQQARGYEMDIKKLDPRLSPGKAEIWLDAASNLPIHCRYEFTEPDVGMHFIVLLEKMQWNADLDAKLFDARPPEKYMDVTPKPPALEEQVREITDAMRIYADAGGGHYPAERGIQKVRRPRTMQAARRRSCFAVEMATERRRGQRGEGCKGDQGIRPDGRYSDRECGCRLLWQDRQTR